MKSQSERDRPIRIPPFLAGGFRPFFLGGALWAATVVVLWVLAFTGRIILPSAFDALAWHRHEMLFGYLAGVVAGFLLTAIPNWTGRSPVNGQRLAALAALWVLARMAVLFSAWTGPLIAAALDIGFLAVLTIVAVHEIVIARNRNVPIGLALAALTLADVLDYAELAGLTVPSGLGWRLGFALVLLMVVLIGGRIIPVFTTNWLKKQGEGFKLPAQAGRFDQATVFLTALALLDWAAASQHRVSAALLITAGVLQAVCLARWHGWQTWREPLVLILHVAYAWLPLGLLLLGGTRFVWCIPQSSAVHALGAGAMASMTLAVMTRATLGHTGHALRADRSTIAIYVLVTLGAILRFAAPMLNADYTTTITVAGLLWVSAFLLFTAAYGPKLISPRIDSKS